MRMKTQYPITLEGKEQLEEELAYLKNVKREELNQKVKEARKFCDFLEDTTFKEMVDERSVVEEKINSLEYTLLHADVISEEEESNSTVHFGSTVIFKELPAGEAETYTIVGDADANPLQNKISYQSPTAQKMLGKAVGDIISVATPAGEMEIKIMEIQ